MNHWSQIIVLGLGSLMFVLLTGTTPGSVGGCSAESTEADPVVACEQIEQLRCTRANERGELNAVEAQTCVNNAFNNDCPTRSWGCDPGPSDAVVGGCVEALRSEDPALRISQLPQCAFCTGAP